MKKFMKPSIPNYISFVVRIDLDGAVEIVVVDIETEYIIGGWSDLLSLSSLKDTVRAMVESRDKKIAKRLCYHERESIRFLSAIILNNVEFDLGKKNYRK